MACDPQTLINNASCIACNIPTGMQVPVLIFLLCQIQANGGTGGGTSGLRGIGSPQGVVTASPGTTYYNGDGSGGFWVKDTGTGNVGWIQLL